MGFFPNAICKGYACKRGANYNELFPFTEVWVFIQYPLYFDTARIHTSLLIPALKDSKCVLTDRKDIPLLFGTGLFGERICEKCSKIFVIHFGIFTEFCIKHWDPQNVEASCIG